MKCKKVQKKLPLLVGGDLSPEQAAGVKAHLDECPVCRDEYEGLVHSLEQLKGWMTEDRPCWREGDWQQAVRGAVQAERGRDASLAPWPFKKAWAFALMVVFAVVLAIFVARPSFFPKRDLEREEYAALPEQDIVSMTMVSKESGLKIVWFFNKNFNLEEKQ